MNYLNSKDGMKQLKTLLEKVSTKESIRYNSRESNDLVLIGNFIARKN